MINVADVAIMTSYLMAWTNTHNALARKMKDQNGALKGAIQMKTVEVVIRLPKDLYKGIECRNGELETEYVCDELMKAIDNGAVLPKGHGRLCDIDAALKCMEEVADDKSNIKECAMGFFDWACSKRVVLEADKEVGDDEV